MTYTVAKATDIDEGQIKVVWAGEKRLALGRVEGKFYAIDDVCTHDGGPLGEGCLMGYEVECPRHGALFDIRTGEALALPAVVGVNSYAVRVEGDRVIVEMPE